jgi:hypothetical protein
LQDNQAGDMQASYNQASDMIGQMKGVVDRLTSEIDDATRTIGTMWPGSRRRGCSRRSRGRGK